MTFTDTNALGNILTTLTPGEGFVIHGVVESENDYSSGVIYNDPSKRPEWSTVLGGRDNEQWVNVRAQRNRKLADCDWTQLDDSVQDKSSWATYRQALRDVPQNNADPFDISWPTGP